MKNLDLHKIARDLTPDPFEKIVYLKSILLFNYGSQNGKAKRNRNENHCIIKIQRNAKVGFIRPFQARFHKMRGHSFVTTMKEPTLD